MSARLPLCLNKLRAIPDGALVLMARFSMAAFFLRAGQSKVNVSGADGIELTSGAVYLFQEEYKVPLLAPETAAWLAAGAEHLFPVLLVIGLATRLSALALLAMTAVIQVCVYPGSWPDHLMWAVMLTLIAARGPGPLALDRLACRKFCDDPAHPST